MVNSLQKIKDHEFLFNNIRFILKMFAINERNDNLNMSSTPKIQIKMEIFKT